MRSIQRRLWILLLGVLLWGHAPPPGTAQPRPPEPISSPYSAKNTIQTTDPTGSNDSEEGYSVGSIWINTATTPPGLWILTDATLGEAIWSLPEGGGATPGLEANRAVANGGHIAGAESKATAVTLCDNNGTVPCPTGVVRAYFYVGADGFRVDIDGADNLPKAMNWRIPDDDSDGGQILCGNGAGSEVECWRFSNAGVLSATGEGGALTAIKSIEFAESDTPPTCAAGNYNISADTSEANLKKCVNGQSSALNTVVQFMTFACNDSTAATEHLLSNNEAGTACVTTDSSSTNTRVQNSRAGTLKNLQCFSDSVLGAGDTFTFTARIGGGDTAIDCVITGAAQTTCSEFVTTAAIAAIDRVSIKKVASNAAADLTGIHCSIEVESP